MSRLGPVKSRSLVVLATLGALVSGGAFAGSVVAADMDGNGRTNMAIYRPDNGRFYWIKDYVPGSLDNLGGAYLGSPGDIPFSADMDGNGKANVGIYRPANGRFYWLADVGPNTFGNGGGEYLGSPGDVPLVADMDGNSRANVAIYRPVNGRFYWLPDSGANTYGNLGGAYLGSPGDIPFAADMDGNRKANVGVYRPANGRFYWLKDIGADSLDNLGGAYIGSAGDIPIVADMDGNGRANPAIYRPANGRFYWIKDYVPGSTDNLGGAYLGSPGDIPFADDTDGNGKANVGIYRPANGRFYWLKDVGPNTFDNLAGSYLGSPGDVPIPSAEVYYPSSWQYGGANHSVDTATEIAAVIGAIDSFTTPYNDPARAFILGLSNDDRARIDTALIGRLKDGDLVVNVDTGMADYYNYAAGELRKLPTMSVIDAVGANLASAKRITAVGLAQLRIGADIGPYKTSWTYGGSNRVVDSAEERSAVLQALWATDDLGAQTLIEGMSPADRAWYDSAPSPTPDNPGILPPNYLPSALSSTIPAPPAPEVPTAGAAAMSYERKPCGSSSGICGSYNAGDAASYARRWYDDFNGNYPRFFDVDCTNFVSQALRAGGMRFLGWNAQQSSGVKVGGEWAWWVNQNAGGSWSQTNSWSTSPGLYKHLLNTAIAKPVAGGESLRVGDVVFFDQNGKTIDGLDHTSIIARVDKSGAWVAQHSGFPVNQKKNYRTLADSKKSVEQAAKKKNTSWMMRVLRPVYTAANQ